MPRTQKLQLSDGHLRRLAQCGEEYKEPGESDDPTRLIKSWLGANDHEKKQLEQLVVAHSSNPTGPSLTATRLKESYPMFAVFTTTVLNQELANAKRRYERASNSKYH
jgi:hypothetical protein